MVLFEADELTDEEETVLNPSELAEEALQANDGPSYYRWMANASMLAVGVREEVSDWAKLLEAIEHMWGNVAQSFKDSERQREVELTPGVEERMELAASLNVDAQEFLDKAEGLIKAAKFKDVNYNLTMHMFCAIRGRIVLSTVDSEERMREGF